MLAVADALRASPVIYALLSVLNHLAVCAGCAVMTAALFRVQPRRNALYILSAALLAAAVGAARPALLNSGDINNMIGSGLLFLLPFLCSLLIFPAGYFKKAAITAFCYTMVEALKYAVLLIFYHYDGEKPDDPTEMSVEIFINAAFFITAVGFMLLFAKKRKLPFPVTRISPVFFILLCLTVGVFITSVVLFGSRPAPGQNVEFIFILMNIPLFAATVALGVASLARDKARETEYQNRIEMQVRHYDMMKQINEEMRIFRHDFPKKLRPLVAYLDKGDTGKAREIASQLDGFVQSTGERFHTGNAALDTVLFCEDQIARLDGNRIVFTFGSVFPENGVAANDIYTIFPNALDNAIEACRETGVTSEITVTSKIVGNAVYLSITNPVAGTVRVRNGVPVTKKADKTAHGYGFRSIRNAAAKYGEDNVTFQTGGGMFELRICLVFR